jgi:hypothetical protein
MTTTVIDLVFTTTAGSDSQSFSLTVEGVITFTTNPSSLALQATVPNLTWIAPAERADGSALVPIDYYTVDYGGVDTVTAPGILVSKILPGHALYYYMPTPEPLKTYRARISATDDNGKTSQLSGFVYVTAAA